MMDYFINKIAVSFLTELNRIRSLPFWIECESFNAISDMDEVSWTTLCKKHNIDSSKLDRKNAVALAEREARLMERYEVSAIDCTESFYPQALLECPDAPIILFYRGKWFPNTPILSIVGTRDASSNCKTIINEIVKTIAERNDPITIASGLAYGIDITAQRAALENGLNTYAVLANGLGSIYPSSHRDTAERIVKEGKGALISEYPCNSLTQRYYFLERNRIIAGMSKALLVGESGLKGGSMVTAKIAFSYGREIMAIPGSPLDEHAQGCNQLIKQDMAALVENGTDVAEFLGLKNMGSKKRNVQHIELTIQEGAVINTIKTEGGSTDLNKLTHATNLSINELSLILLNLELNGLVESLPGALWKIHK